MNNSIDNDLQKAIDDITKTTGDDPIFADPVAAPTPALGAMPPGMNEPALAPKPVSRPAPAPTSITEDIVSIDTVTAAPTVEAPAEPVAPVEAPAAPVITETPTAPTVAETPAPETPAEPEPAPESITPSAPAEPFLEQTDEDLDKDQVKEAALRDLAPILKTLDISAEKKFDLYKTVIDDYNDSSVISPAYKAAAKIEDDKERAEAMLYLVEKIENL